MNRRIIAALIASLGVTGPLSTAVRAQSDDVRREDPREVRVEVPRAADGHIDLEQLRAEIRQAFAQGARDVRIREEGLNAQERQQLADLARQLAGELGVERLRVREDGNRLRIELREDRREARREDRREDRREERQEDRREDRAERREDRREDRVERVERREQRAERPERNERAERPERNERVERPERNERVERPERNQRPERPERGGPGRG